MNGDEPRMRPPDLKSMVDFQKMVFIYNTVQDGWTARLLSDGRYEFRKADRVVKSDSDSPDSMDNYLKRFIEFYMQLRHNKNQK